MTEVAIRIERFVDDHQPGIVECRLVDAHGQSHLFVEKAPVVSSEHLGPDSAYPRPGVIGCVVEAEWIDEQGRAVAQVNTERPWSVASTTGSTRFVVLSSQISRP
jgi:hypothetical protein